MNRRDIQHVDKLVEMEINNEIRRLRIKLKLFEQEGFNWVMGDVIQDMASFDVSAEDIAHCIELQKKEYLRQLEALLPKDNKQGKLNI